VKLAFAGAGTISVVHAMAAAAVEAEIVAVASRTNERATERAAQVGAQVVAFEDLPAGADAVVVCTPPDRHTADTLQALRAGAVVLVEKPLATTLAEADAIVDAGGQVIYAENLAFSPLVVATNELVRAIGALNFIEIRQLSPRPSWGEFLDPARGGGVLFDLGSHAVALALLLAGADAPVTVEATMSHSADIEVDDAAEVLITFASGMRARIETNWTNPHAVWDIQVSSDSGVVRTELMPQPGIEHNGEPVALPALASAADPHLEHYGYIDQMLTLRDVVGGAPSPIDARFGRRVLDVLSAAYTAASKPGSTVSLPFAGPRNRTPHQLWSDTVGP
jgi:predicted dehydrogenase